VIFDQPRPSAPADPIGNAAAARATPMHTLLMTLSSWRFAEADRLSTVRPGMTSAIRDGGARARRSARCWRCRVGAMEHLFRFFPTTPKRPAKFPLLVRGPYGTLHGAMEMCAPRPGIKLLHIPFAGRGGPRAQRHPYRTVPALASAPGNAEQQVDDGKMRVLANWARSDREFSRFCRLQGLGYKDVEFYIWSGLFAHAALPARS